MRSQFDAMALHRVRMDAREYHPIIQSKKHIDIEAYNNGRVMFYISRLDGDTERISLCPLSHLRDVCRIINLPGFTQQVLRAIAYKEQHPTTSFILMFERENGCGITFHDY